MQTEPGKVFHVLKANASEVMSQTNKVDPSNRTKLLHLIPSPSHQAGLTSNRD